MLSTRRRGARGRLSLAEARVVLIVSEFHPDIARGLLAGATRVLGRAGIPASRHTVLNVSGVFELPMVAARAARRRPAPHAIIALGALVKGQTAQYEVIAHAVAGSLLDVAIRTGIPITFGVIVAQTLAQARARALRGPGNRGMEAATAALGLLKTFAAMPER
jgi:6,7-dimethyl-8-ribityllumazine synthase